MPDPTLPAPPPLVSILIISYNTKAMTLACLASIAAETKVAHEVIVLDNASPDGSAAAIAAAHPGIRLIASAVNHGFARGNNLAAAEARGRYLLLLNPDTLVLDGAIDRLAGFAGRTPEAGIWGGRTVFPDGSLNPMSVFGDQTLWSVFCRTSGLALAFTKQPRLQPRGHRRLGARQRARRRRGAGLLLPDPPRSLGCLGRLRRAASSCTARRPTSAAAPAPKARGRG